MYKCQCTRNVEWEGAVARRQVKALAVIACYSNAYLLVHIRIQINVTVSNR